MTTNFTGSVLTGDLAVRGHEVILPMSAFTIRYALVRADGVVLSKASDRPTVLRTSRALWDNTTTERCADTGNTKILDASGAVVATVARLASTEYVPALPVTE